MGDAADEGDAALAQQLGRSLAALAESREAVSQQKEAMEAMAARIAELEERDATTMDIKKLNDIAGERTRKTVGECVATHTRQRRDLDKLRFEVVQSGPEKGSLNVRSPLITDGHAVAQVYPRGLVHYLAAVIKDSDDEDGVCRGEMQSDISTEDGSEDGEGPSMRTLEAMAEVRGAMGGEESDDDAVIGGFEAEEGERTAGGPARGRARRVHYKRSTPERRSHRVNFVTEQIMAAHQEARAAKRYVGPYSRASAGLLHQACRSYKAIDQMQAAIPSFPTGIATQKAHDATTKKYLTESSKPECEVLNHAAVEARNDVVIGMLDNVQKMINTWGARLRARDMEAKKEHLKGGIGSNQGAVELSGLLSGETPVTDLQKQDHLRPRRDEKAAKDAVAAGRLQAGYQLIDDADAVELDAAIVDHACFLGRRIKGLNVEDVADLEKKAADGLAQMRGRMKRCRECDFDWYEADWPDDAKIRGPSKCRKTWPGKRADLCKPGGGSPCGKGSLMGEAEQVPVRAAWLTNSDLNGLQSMARLPKVLDETATQGAD